MNGINNPIIFYITSIGLIIFSILVIQFKNIFYSLLSAIVVFFLIGLVFYILGSEYNAVVQIAIYGVAVPIILGLAVMFTDTRSEKKSEKRSNLKYLILLISCIFILALIYLIMISYAVMPIGFNNCDLIKNSPIQVMNAFGYGIFVKYVWAFEIISIVLTLTVAGLTLLDKKKEDKCQK